MVLGNDPISKPLDIENLGGDLTFLLFFNAMFHWLHNEKKTDFLFLAKLLERIIFVKYE